MPFRPPSAALLIAFYVIAAAGLPVCYWELDEEVGLGTWEQWEQWEQLFLWV